MQTNTLRVDFDEGIAWGSAIAVGVPRVPNTKQPDSGRASASRVLRGRGDAVGRRAVRCDGSRIGYGEARKVLEAFTGAPLVFEANRGQADAQVQFVARGAGFTAFLTSTETVLRLGMDGSVRLKPVGADPAARISGDEELPGVVNYFRHEPSTAISAPTYRGVRYVGIYPGIDLLYHARSGRLEYDFIVAPGADPDRIGLEIDGAERVELDAEGTLVMHTASGDVRQPRPFAYQEIDGVARPVTAGYVFDTGSGVRLRLGAYDRSQQLVIDPVITYATYLGGAGDEAEENLLGEVHIARDGAGNIYMTGTTRSTNFPTTAYDFLRGERGPVRDQVLACGYRPLLDVPGRLLRGLRERHRGRQRRERVCGRRSERRRRLLLDSGRAGREARSGGPSRLLDAPRWPPARLVVRNRNRGGRRGTRVRHRPREDVRLPDDARRVPDDRLHQRQSHGG